MVDLLVLTVVLPLLGAGGILLSSSVSSKFGVKRRYTRLISAALAIGITGVLSVLVVEIGSGWKISLSSLYPSLLGEAVVEIRWDSTLWPLGLGLSVSIGCLFLGAVGSDKQQYRFMGAVLTLLSAGLAALWSANPLTTILCWALYDLVSVVGSITAGSRSEDVIRSLAVTTVSVLLLWAGALVTEGGIGSVQWALMPAGGAKMTYWILAGLLRLGAYPLHLSLPRRVRSGSPMVAALFLGPILGWALWIRLALLSGQALFVGVWTIVPALLTLVAGGILGWTADSPQESRPWISMGGNGTLLLATALVSLAGSQPGTDAESVVPVMILGAMGWMLGTSILFLGEGLDVRGILQARMVLRGAPALIGALSLVGAPFTVGFVGEAPLVRELIGHERWGWSVGFLVGQLFLVAAVARWLLASGPTKRESDNILQDIACSAALIVLAAFMLVIGFMPKFLFDGFDTSSAPSLMSLLAEPGLMGWGLWVGATLLGGALAWLGRDLRPRISLWLDVVHDVMLFDWGYELLTGALAQGLGLLRVLDDVLGGRGAVLWSCLLLLILLLMVGG